MKLAKPQKADIAAARREIVASLRLRQLTVREIAAQLETRGMVNPDSGEAWSHTTIENDLKALKKVWETNAAGDMAEHQARQIAEITEIKRAAWAGKNPKLALEALDREMKILGTMRQTGGLSLTIVNIDLVNRTVEALQAAGIDPVQTFENLIRKAAARVDST